jgi:hypothetical protein
MFWVYLLGIVLVLGAELNAFLEEPGRSTALAETKAKAEKGQVATQQAAGGVLTVAAGSAAPGGNEPSSPPPNRSPHSAARLYAHAAGPARRKPATRAVPTPGAAPISG